MDKSIDIPARRISFHEMKDREPMAPTVRAVVIVRGSVELQIRANCPLATNASMGGKLRNLYANVRLLPTEIDELIALLQEAKAPL